MPYAGDKVRTDENKVQVRGSLIGIPADIGRVWFTLTDFVALNDPGDNTCTVSFGKGELLHFWCDCPAEDVLNAMIYAGYVYAPVAD